jgi:hypothetical protein
VTPFYSLSILPAMIAVYPGFHLTEATALIPVANIALVMRAALQGDVSVAPFLLALVWSLLLTATLLAFAAWLFRQEDVLVGTAGGSLLSYVRRRLGLARRVAAERR